MANNAETTDKLTAITATVNEQINPNTFTSGVKASLTNPGGNMKYKAVIESGHWSQADGSFIEDDDCGHLHDTVEEAGACLASHVDVPDWHFKGCIHDQQGWRIGQESGLVGIRPKGGHAPKYWRDMRSGKKNR